jgi:hypothetical protein
VADQEPTVEQLAGTPYDQSGLLRPPAAATGLSALRVLTDGEPRQYSAVEFTRGWWGLERFIRTLRAVGFIRPSTRRSGGYAVLDVLDADGDIIADYDIPTARAFRYVKRKLKLTVVDVEAEVAAYRAGGSRG